MLSGNVWIFFFFWFLLSELRIVNMMTLSILKNGTDPRIEIVIKSMAINGGKQYLIFKKYIKSLACLFNNAKRRLRVYCVLIKRN